jgi:hypothetical protein
MNSRQYEKMMNEAYKRVLTEAGIEAGDYTSVCLSADRTEYTVTMKDGSTRIISSGFEYCED